MYTSTPPSKWAACHPHSQIVYPVSSAVKYQTRDAKLPCIENDLCIFFSENRMICVKRIMLWTIAIIDQRPAAHYFFLKQSEQLGTTGRLTKEQRGLETEFTDPYPAAKTAQVRPAQKHGPRFLKRKAGASHSLATMVREKAAVTRHRWPRKS